MKHILITATVLSLFLGCYSDKKAPVKNHTANQQHAKRVSPKTTVNTDTKNNTGNSVASTDENKTYPVTNSSPLAGSDAATGLYVTTAWQKNSIDDSYLKSPYIDGMFERLYWNYFEPERGKYDWSYLDSEFDRVIKYKKKISLGIAAGNGQPEWIYKENIPFLNFVEIPMQGKSKYVNELKLPVFWNQKYIQIWTEFVAALGKHIQENPKYWDALSMIKVTGFNQWNSDELRIPAQKDVSNSQARSTDAVKIWKENSYKPSVLISAYKQVADSFAKYFPGKVLCVPVIAGGRGLPHIGEDGQEIKNSQDDMVSQRVLDYMTTKYGKQFMAMYEALQDKQNDGSISLMVTAQYKKGCTIGYQLCQACYKFPPCLKDNSKCDNDAFYGVLENGMNQGARYFELYANNITAYPEALQKAQQQIRQLTNNTR